MELFESDHLWIYLEMTIYGTTNIWPIRKLLIDDQLRNYLEMTSSRTT